MHEQSTRRPLLPWSHMARGLCLLKAASDGTSSHHVRNGWKERPRAPNYLQSFHRTLLPPAWPETWISPDNLSTWLILQGHKMSQLLFRSFSMFTMTYRPPEPSSILVTGSISSFFPWLVPSPTKSWDRLSFSLMIHHTTTHSCYQTTTSAGGKHVSRHN